MAEDITHCISSWLPASDPSLGWIESHAITVSYRTCYPLVQQHSVVLEGCVDKEKENTSVLSKAQ
jgi:hypothetical protein